MEGTSDTALKQRWGFLVPWCKVLENRIHYVWAEREEEVWDVPKRRLEVELPTRNEVYRHLWEEPQPLYSNEKEFQAGYQKVQEALALLSAVAHVDQEGWRYLLNVHCYAEIGIEGQEVYEEEIPARFLLFLIEDNDKEECREYAKTLRTDIVQFCGVHQRERPSRAYSKALKQIAAVAEELKPGSTGIDIKIPVQVGFRVMDFMSYGVLSDILEPLEDIRAAELAIQEEWEAYEQNPRKKKAAVEPGALRCTFVLGPTIADFHDTPISGEVVKKMRGMVRGNARFSQINLWTHIDRELEKKQHEGRVVFSQFVATIFDSTRRVPELKSGKAPPQAVQVSGDSEPLQMGTVHAECTSLIGPRNFESLCSAITTSQTTKKLSMQLEMDLDDNSSVHWWKWLAYAVFSKRAKACSAVEALALISIRSMSSEDIDAFSAVLASEHPEEELFGCPHREVEERDATVKTGATLFWEMNNRGHPRRSSRAVTSEFPIECVRTFRDDGVSEWVNALVPGYGRCHVRRGDLEFHQADTAIETSSGVTDLRIGFDKVDPSVSDGLSKFLAAIGSSLKVLTLDTANIEIDMNALLRSCPNLEQLTLCGGEMVDMRLDFSEYHKRNQPIPELSFEWESISALATELKNSDSALTKCLRRLRVHLIDQWAAWGVIVADNNNRPAFQAGLRALLEMLEVNQTLEFLDVVVPFGHFIYLDDFRQHHLKPINRAAKLPTETKTAFLSVFSAREELAEANKKHKRRVTRAAQDIRPLCRLDQHVLSNIFSFAAPRVLRQVYLHDPPRNELDEPERLPL
ncbi:hypothetical protein PF005_g19761 [Phytophthora fragariae]|uniref:Uncharacterized protein n=1 Tax=Phytophthora fragariae TaxID=53985 RepID=A0A6A3SUP6_9STRA|nr:hypothetical protein PF009_g20759 [Phytophthora fragariae]KAE9089117.1 hypothetical protein PF010_g19124 [Phytophthora fragariae]KAE9089545.1 hypothetical protein PF007_g19560 [Phytophthora fragariae]KAE9118473.1 hypothetical protein PF006_g18578 [Phytophthora fragariae]KAE9189139.1 hypothetical protein PF005_g19761 [Phytophthora fragariae]